MEVKLLKDFRGKETEEVFYPAGSIAAVKDHHAKRLIELGFAEEWKGDPVVVEPPAPVVEEVQPAPEPETEPPAPVVKPKPKRQAKK